MSSHKVFSRGLLTSGAAILFCSQAAAQRPLGIDVSHYQGSSINWTSVKNSGRTFAWAKASEGVTYTDPDFTINAVNAKTAGVLIGAYHYARYDNNLGTNGAAAEAAHFWSVAKNYIKGSGTYMMPMLDVEQTPGTNYNKTTLSQWVNVWCSNVVYSASLSNVTVKPVIYASSSFAGTWLNSSVASQWTPWIANWNGQDPQTGSPSPYSPWSTWTVWQYSATETVPGVSGNCDADVFNGTSNSLATLVVGGLGPPFILSQPSNRYGDQGGSLTMTVTAGGVSPLIYQWRLNGANISSATNNALTLTNIQLADAGSYTCKVTNSSGSITSSAATFTVNPLFSTVFSDNFDVISSASWTTNKSSADTRVTFAYDYTAIGVPSAPNSTNGTKKGLRFEANLTGGATAAINVSPVGQSFSGNYRLHFDMWINANGPFPLGGTGSTEHLTAGVGTAGNKVQWNSGTADGFWFAIDGEGQATDTSATLPDVRAYSGITLQQTNSGVYAGGPEPNVRGNGHAYYSNVFPGGQAAPATQQSNYAQQTGSLDVGCVGFAWRDVVVNKTNNIVEWFIDGLKICTITNANFAASNTNIFVGYWDSFTSISDNTNLSFGLVDNVRVEVQVGTPTISSQPQNQIVTQGSNATFSVTASGSPTPGYQWRFNGANIASATASSYTKTSAQPGDAGSYTVLVTNTSGSITSSVATLTVNVPPSISAHPQNLTVNQTSNATFTVTASGTPSPGYQWRFNGANISGATASSHTRSNAQSGDAGSYTVAVTNVAGSVTSSVAVLTVNVPPSISAQPQNQTVTQGSNATFTVTASGTPLPGYQWRFNGTDISAATASSYTKSSAQPGDAGSYSVVITNVAGSITSSVATLAVNIPPSISAPPQSLTVNPGSNATMSVVADGTAPLSYQWQREGTNISGTASSYTWSSAQTNDSGNYRVIVTNVAGSVTSAVAVLSVNVAPSITAQPQDETATVGHSATFNVTAGGTAPLSYQWQFNGTNISGATTNSYTKSGVQMGDAGSYCVIVTNVAGTVASSNALLTVTPPPPPRFELLTQFPGESAHLFLSGEIGNAYEIQSSSNLLDWTSIGTITNTNDVVEFIDASAVTRAQQYYRAKLVP